MCATRCALILLAVSCSVVIYVCGLWWLVLIFFDVILGWFNYNRFYCWQHTRTQKPYLPSRVTVAICGRQHPTIIGTHKHTRKYFYLEYFQYIKHLFTCKSSNALWRAFILPKQHNAHINFNVMSCLSFPPKLTHTICICFNQKATIRFNVCLRMRVPYQPKSKLYFVLMCANTIKLFKYENCTCKRRILFITMKTPKKK